MDLQIITEKVCNIARLTGKFIHKELHELSAEDIETKSKNNFVTYVDKKAEQILVDELKTVIPGSGFITEEKTVKNARKEYTWIIDPLDGTTNYINHIPIYSVSIALMQHNEPIMGVVFEINTKECFYAYKGAGAYLDGKEIRVSRVAKLSGALLATGFPYYDYRALDNYVHLLKGCMKYTTGIRRLGSAAVDLAYVACGRFEIFFEYGLNPWDVAAGAFIVKQAGGRVTDFRNGNDFLFGQEIIASNSITHNAFMDLLQKSFA